MRLIQSLGKANQATLRKELGFKTINEAIEFYGLGQIKKKRQYSDKTKMIAYEIMRNEYNKIVEDINQQTKEINRIKANEKAREKRQTKKIKTFMLEIKVEIIYDKYPEKVFIKNLVILSLKSLTKLLII